MHQSNSPALNKQFSIDSAGMTLPSMAGVGNLLVQSTNVNYNQGVTRLYEIGTNYTYLVAGRAIGLADLGRVVAPRGVQVRFYEKLGSLPKDGEPVQFNSLERSTGEIEQQPSSCASVVNPEALTFNVRHAFGTAQAVAHNSMVVVDKLSIAFSSVLSS